MKKILVLSSFLIFALAKVKSQNVAINNDGSTADPSAILHIKATNKGMLMPNVALTSTLDVATITTPATSLLIYNTATAGVSPSNVTPGYYYFNGTLWVRLSTLNKAWELGGNTSITAPTAPLNYGLNTINAGSNFLGTLDANDLVFGTNNFERLRILNTNGNIGIGTSAPTSPLHVNRSTSGSVITATSSFVGTIDGIAFNGTSNNSPGYGIGGRFTGGWKGVEANSDGLGYGFETYAITANATGTAGTHYGIFSTAFGTGNNTAGYFNAIGGTNNYSIIVPNLGGMVGIGTTTPTTLVDIVRTNAGDVTRSVSSYLGSFDYSAITGASVNAPGYGYGGRFTGGYMGVEAESNATTYTGTSYAVRGTASGSAGVHYGGYFNATGTGGNNYAGYFNAANGSNNYAVVVPNGGGRSGFGTLSPNLAHLQVEGMVGNTTALFKSGIGQGVSFTSNWPGVYLNCYYDGGVRAMAGSGYPFIVNGHQADNALDFASTPIANTVAGGIVAPIVRMRVQGDGRVSIGYDDAFNYNALAKLSVKDPTATDADINMFYARHSGFAGTTWQMGSIEFYTEGLDNIGFTSKVSPLNGNGFASLGSAAASRYNGYRWGTLYTTTNVDVSSDITLKKKIETQNYGVHALRKINPITYLLKEEYGPQGTRLDDKYKKTYIGFNAQELKQVIPEVVSSTHLISNYEDGFIEAKTPTLGVRYGDLIPVTVTAIKELDEQQTKIINTINLSDFGTETTNGSETNINFSADFVAKLQGKPVVTITALQPNVNFYISKITNNGFTVRVVDAPVGAAFNWIAMAKINTESLAITNKVNLTEHEAKLAKLAAHEASLPTNEEAIKMAKAHGEELRKIKEADGAKNAKNPQKEMDQAMQKGAANAKAEYEDAAKKLREAKDDKPQATIKEEVPANNPKPINISERKRNN